MNTHPKVTDLRFLSDFAKGDTTKMKRYVEMFLKSTPKVIDELQLELDEQNWENLMLKAHSIKPQAQYMGIPELKNTLLEIENVVKENKEKDGLQDLVTGATDLTNKAVDELNEFLEK